MITPKILRGLFKNVFTQDSYNFHMGFIHLSIQISLKKMCETQVKIVQIQCENIYTQTLKPNEKTFILMLNLFFCLIFNLNPILEKCGKMQITKHHNVAMVSVGQITVHKTGINVQFSFSTDVG